MVDADSNSLFYLLEKLRTHPTTTPEWDYFTNSAGLKLFYRVFKPASQKIKKVIVGCHGMAAEGDYFVLYADQIVEQTGSAFYVMDYRGHGRSEGPKGDIKDFQLILDDYKEFTEYLQTIHPNTPIFVFGESMGGVVSLNFAIQNPELLQGIVEFAPAVKVIMGSFSIKDVLKFIGGFIIYLFKPGKHLFATKGNEAAIIRDETHQRFDFENPYHLEAVSLRYIFQVNKFSKKAYNSGERIEIPIIIFQGKDDKVVNAEGVSQYFETIKSEDKELVLVPKSYHVLTTDPAFIEWGWDKLRDWLNSH